MVFADVIVDISVKSLDRPFQYLVPEDMILQVSIGSQVTIPFGQGNRQMKGFVIALSGKPKFDIARTKSIIAVEKQGVVAESHLLSLAYWMKENYGSTMNDAIKAVMPVRRVIKEKTERQVYPLVDAQRLKNIRDEFFQKHNTARVRILDGFLEKQDSFEKGLDYDYCTKVLKGSAKVLKDLEERGILSISSRQQYRNPIGTCQESDKKVVLNEEQKKIVDTFLQDYKRGIRKNYLIHGVTGSGKTEVYMNLIQGVMEEGKQAIVLIPEIALTFQTVNRFYARFGNKVSVIHSRLSAGERYDQFTRAKRGEIQIMIGPRSALFTPFVNLGLIIIDEEHESSYQSETVPKYHAREVAVERGRMLGASVVMGSATPSLETYYRCQTGEYTLFTMKHRTGKAALPQVHIADLRSELANRNYSIFSRKLQESIEDRLKKREQIILFLNRRGYAGFVSCRQCGQVIECPNCSVSLKAHEYNGKVSILKCHYCGVIKPMPNVCPSCGSKYIGTFGLGTQQVEEMVKKRFLGARVLRMDADTTSTKGGHREILQAFSQGKGDILVGTQMIVKGHDFPNVTLVGILAADLSLNGGDYRASERTFQLLAQAAGRAGRGEKPGEVILQTYQPEHYAVVCAAKNDYETFYQKEMSKRQMLQYPPISNILEVLVSSEKKESVEEFSEKLREKMTIYEQVSLLGPTDAPIAKMHNVYRKVLYIKSQEYAVLRNIKNELEEYIGSQEGYKECSVVFGFNQ